MGYFNVCAQEIKITITIIYKLYKNTKIFLRTTDFDKNTLFLTTNTHNRKRAAH